MLNNSRNGQQIVLMRLGECQMNGGYILLAFYKTKGDNRGFTSFYGIKLMLYAMRLWTGYRAQIQPIDQDFRILISLYARGLGWMYAPKAI